MRRISSILAATRTTFTTSFRAVKPRLWADSTARTMDAYQQRVFSDAQACIGKLAGLTDAPLDTMAYPYGITSPAATELVAKAGIRYAFTISPEMATRSADQYVDPADQRGQPRHHAGAAAALDPAPGCCAAGQRAAARGRGRCCRAARRQRRGEGGELRLRLGQEAFTLQVNAKTATRGDARVRLRQPVLREHGQVTIALDDLQALIGQPLVYTPATGKVAVRVAPSVKYSELVTRYKLEQ